jgi:Ca-activated chloride channel family protein
VSFAHPGWLWVAPALVAALITIWSLHDRRQRRTLERFLAPHLAAELTRSVSRSRRWAQRTLFALSLVSLCVALAEPRAGFRLETFKERGTAILFAVDTSRSMLTPDLRPDRLTRAKLAIEDLLNGALEGDAVGLIAFAGSAFLQCPITLDHGAFAESVAALDTHVIPRGGTDIGSAIREAREAFRARQDVDKVLVLLTDGEDLAGEALEAARGAAREGLRIDTVGVGTPGGDLIPLPAESGGGFLKDRDGHLVKSRLDEATLAALAAATGGRYVVLGADNRGLEALYREALAPRAKHEMESRTERVYLERFQWPLAAALLALIASGWVRTRRPLPRRVHAPDDGASLEPASPERAASHSPSHRAAALALLFATLSIASARVQAGTVAATEQYNRGTAAYKAGDYAHAVEAFRASLAAQPSGDAARLAEQEDTYYNLGNGLYRLGERSVAQDPKRTREAWTQAIAAYDAALELKPQDADGRFNRDFVKRKLEDLERSSSRRSSSSGNASNSASSGSSGAQPQSSPQSQSAQSGQPQPSGGGPAKPHQGTSAQNPSPAPGQSAGAPSSPPTPSASGSASTSPPEGEAPSSASQAQLQSQSQSQSQPPRAGRATADAKSSQNPPGSSASAQLADRAPDTMSAEEARELLDSARDEERRLPAAPSARNEGALRAPDEPVRDW